MDQKLIPGIIQKIGQKHGLHVDQIGILEEEIAHILLGRSHTDDFVENIENRLNIDSDTAIDIATDVNIQIFLAARNSAIETKPSTEEQANASKESILAEIENPSPTIHPISAADQTIAGPAKSREIITAPETAITANTATPNFLAQKLGASMNTPTPKITDRAPIPSEKPKSYATDPYREPIN